ncbi:MAG: glycosyltransferase [Nitrososphaerota archaeon]|nr:glycosyltransferase [Nitrososphaerota archaeon]
MATKFSELELLKYSFPAEGESNFPAGTVCGPIKVDPINAEWGLVELRLSGTGPFFLPQLIVASDDKDEQNIAISLTSAPKRSDGIQVFSAHVSSERLQKRLYLIPSLKSCSIKLAKFRVVPMTKGQVLRRFLTNMTRSPGLVVSSIINENLGYRFQSRQHRLTLATALRSLVEVASRNFPDPNQLRFGKDPRYSQWTNTRFETLIPRQMLPDTRSRFPLSVAVLAAKEDSGALLSLTMNSLYSAGISSDSVFLIDGAETTHQISPLTTVSDKDFQGHLANLEQERFLLCLRAGDTVSRDLLDSCAEHSSTETTEILYFDHDHLGHEGTYCEFDFKPDTSPNTLLFRNYLSRAALARISKLSSLLEQAPKIRSSGILGLIYGCAIQASQQRELVMVHVPVPAIHLRKESSEELAERSNNEQTARTLLLESYAANLIIYSSYSVGATWRSRSQPQKKVSIVIPTKNRVDLLRPAVDSILDMTLYPNYEIVIVDNQSDDMATLSFLEELSESSRASIVTFDEAFNFARIHNMIVPHLNSDYVLLLNNDTEVTNPMWLTRLVDLFDLPNIGIVGNKLLYPDGTIQHAGATGGLKGPMAHHLVGHRENDVHPLISFPRDVLAVTGACLLIPTKLYLDCHGMDEKLAVSYNDMDLCLSVRETTGKAVVVSSSGGVIHKESKSRGTSFSAHEQQLLNIEADYFNSKWLARIRPDPFYNPNLSLERDFDLA